MRLERLGDIEARISNANLPDEDAQLLIDCAVEQAAAEVFERLTEARTKELYSFHASRERDRNQAEEARANRDSFEREQAVIKRRKAELKEAEDLNGPPVRRMAL